MSAKDIIIKPIGKKDADRICKKHHYSGKVVQNSQVHFGVFYKDNCEGVLQFGPSLDKSKIVHLVKGTKFYNFLELNRMAFSEKLPRFSESRAISICMKMLKKNYPHLDWIVTFADGTQCGDGTIYRASNFVLTGIRKNESLRKHKVTGEIIQKLTAHTRAISSKVFTRDYDPLPGYQFRYMYFLKPELIKNLIVPTIHFDTIKEMGIGMYKGKKRNN
jgi:hypothetical protein|tara:strand:+ start:270 stop:923 length:654 start_codon:yes stop_codon:yes gene_type:complete